MSLQQIEPGASIGALRGDVAVCVVLEGSSDALVCCVDSVVRHTDPDVPLLICATGPIDPRVLKLFDRHSSDEGRRRNYFLLTTGSRPNGVSELMDVAINTCAPADVAVLTRACTVAEGWLLALRIAASSDDRVATVSALSDRSGALSLADDGLSADWAFADAAAAVSSLEPMHPRILCAAAPCVYMSRSALELVGALDLSLQGDAALIDFSQRSLARGLIHLAADNMLVSDHGARSAGLDETDEPRWLLARYPYLEQAQGGLEREEAAPLARALASARITLRDLSVTLDARALTPGLNGTKLHILELAMALVRSEGIRVRAVVPDDLGDYARPLRDLPDLELLRLQDVTHDTPVDDVVHRPHQVSSVGDLDLFNSLGRRLVITQQDLINFHNPAYFSSGAEWHAHRRLTRTALALADRVVFFSHYVANDAQQERLLDDRRTCVVPIGIDHQLLQLAEEARRPRGAESLEGVEFLVCLGSDFGHKNNAFAIDLFRALCDRHGWSGKLVLAGPTVPHGSSAAQEVEARLPYPQLDGSVLKLGSVGEAGKAWLLRHATAIVYPSVVEGFGLVPFEAAQAGVPCLFATGTALAEMLPPEAGTIVPWSATHSADRAIGLLSEHDARTAHVRAVREAGARFTWRETAERLLVVYREAVRDPGSPGQAIAAEALDRERELAAARAETAASRAETAALQSAVEDHERRWSALGEDALRLVGPHGTIPAELQRPLLAVSTRRYLRRPFFDALRAGYALSRRVGRHFGS